MDAELEKIYDLILEHLKDDDNGYNETGNQYYFGRYCSSKEIYTSICRLLEVDIKNI